MVETHLMFDMRILVVDDEPINRVMLLNMLEQQGYKKCYEAANGKEAVALANQILPDLILLDIAMPEMDGLEAARVLKQDNDIYLPIIFITAFNDKQNLIKCLEAGGNDFVAKPFDKAILSAKITAHLRSRQMSQRIEKQNAELSAFHAETVLEHDMVDHIYRHGLKNSEKAMAFFDVAQIPATTFNGDLFLLQPHPNGGAYFFLGDFTGHGLASTMGALPVSSAFTEMAANGLSVMEFAHSLNSLLYNILPIDRFSAAIIGYINDIGSRLVVWQGGMPDAYVHRADTNEVCVFSAKHMALGILSPEEFESDCSIIDLNPGDIITVFSDGLVEATFQSADGEQENLQMLGEKQVDEWLTAEPALSANSLYQKALDETDRSQFDDDVTIVRFTATDLQSLKRQTHEIGLPFVFRVSLGPEELRDDNALDSVFQIINNQTSLAGVRADLFTVLSEMYMNALEHGVLHLDSKLKASPDGFADYYHARERKLASLEEGNVIIEIELKSKQRRIAVTVTDSGDGFDYTAKQGEGVDASSGRGIFLLNEICHSVQFAGSGNRVTAEMKI